MGHASAQLLWRISAACRRLASLAHEAEMTQMLRRMAEDWASGPYQGQNFESRRCARSRVSGRRGYSRQTECTS
jgi:hypothetical protein